MGSDRTKGGISVEEAKVKLLVYATPDERTRIKLAATKLGMSMTQFMLTPSWSRS